MNYNHLHFDEIDSTNSYLKNTHKVLDNFTFVSTDYQSKGKGRNDRVWESEKGQNLMFSFLIKERKLLDVSPLLSIMTAVEVARVLESYHIDNVSIKWPNDILINDKKICGILLEGQLPTYVVVGVGLNVNQLHFPNDLRRPATSMANELNKEINLDTLRGKIFSNIVRYFSELNTGVYLSYFNKHNYLLHKKIRVMINGLAITGEVVGIDADFNLRIFSNNSLLSVNSGEIEIV